MFFDRFNVYTLLFTVAAVSLTLAISGIYAYASLALALTGATVFSVRNYQNRAQTQPLVPVPQPVENLPNAPTNGESLKNMFLADLTTRNSGLGLPEFPNAISDDYYNEAMMYVQLKFDAMGEQNFHATYKSKETDDIIQEVISLLPLNHDNELAAIARKLNLKSELTDEINTNYIAVEDDLFIIGGKLKRHEQAFHAQYYFLSDEQKTNLKKLADLKQKDFANKYPDNITLQANGLFLWISNLCQNFKFIVSNINQHIETAQTALISKVAEHQPIIPPKIHSLDSQNKPEEKKSEPQPAIRLSREDLRQRRLDAMEKRTAAANKLK